MPFPPDRSPFDFQSRALETLEAALPLPPLNFSVTTSFERQSNDLRWSSPSELNVNTKFTVVGVNLYRSFDSEFGPFFRLNLTPIGSNFYRDKTEIVLELNENVSDRFIARGAATDPTGDFIFRTLHKPIVLSSTSAETDCTNLNVQVTINGVPAFVESINGPAGEITLRKFDMFDIASQIQIPVVLPTNPNDLVLCTYRRFRNRVNTDLTKRIFYRATTVARDQHGDLFETPLDRAAVANNYELEKLDYIWREAIRRNKWILDQGGERVKLFIRKLTGDKCGCVSDTHRQTRTGCKVCFETGVIGGYEGPFDIIIAPDDGERAAKQTNKGRTLEHSYDTWTTPVPLISQRDFIVKLNNDRYGIGPVRMPSNRGMLLQQFFSISSFDESDIRYEVPVVDVLSLKYPESRYVIPGQGSATPMITERVTIPDERETRGFTIGWENSQRR
jgi:hypothetical protein